MRNLTKGIILMEQGRKLIEQEQWCIDGLDEVDILSVLEELDQVMELCFEIDDLIGKLKYHSCECIWSPFFNAMQLKCI